MPNDLCFDWKRPCFGGSTFKYRGHLDSRYIYIDTILYIYIYLEPFDDPSFAWNLGAKWMGVGVQ